MIIMRKLFQILILIILKINVSGQHKLPTNLKQTVKYLDKECPEGVKSQIKNSHKDSLAYTVYPFAKKEPSRSYKTIYHWTSNENGNPKLVKYLEEKGIFYQPAEVLLFAFNQYLINGEIKEKDILKKYIDFQKLLDDKEKVRYVTDSINNVYIPINIEDCFSQINTFWADSTKVNIKNLTEEEFSSRFHHGFGMWIRNNWQLWGGSRLSKYFNDLGIHHPDDMSGIILTSYHRHLKNKEIELDNQVKYYQEYWAKTNAEQIKNTLEEFSAYKIGDTLEFKYNKGYVSKEQEDKDDDGVCIAKGIITERNEKDFLIKVKIIETCDKNGIIYFDNDGHRIYDQKTKRWSNPSKRIIKKVKANKEQWFEYKDWEPIEQ